MACNRPGPPNYSLNWRSTMQSPCLTPGWNAAITAALMAILPGCVTKQAPEQKPTLEQELRSAGGFEWMLQDPESRRAQILITEIVKDPNGRTQLRSHGYRVDAEYFYPASAIKLCAAVAALQLIETLEHTHGLADLAKAPLRIEPLFPGDRAQTIDDPKPPKVPLTVGREIRKLCLVSDNPAFNRLFDLVGHAEMNQSMHALGLNSVVINHRLSESRKIPNPQAAAGVSFHPPGRPPILIAPRTSDLKFANSKPGLLVGSSYLQGDGKVDRPMDFTRRNGISLVDLQGLLIKVVRP
ncbi:MAG: serine hydrolase, partial [Verrucomicrobia bacterium]|nr:serine hydrolase [Verrucomicrobiota bacterium]